MNNTAPITLGKKSMRPSQSKHFMRLFICLIFASSIWLIILI